MKKFMLAASLIGTLTMATPTFAAVGPVDVDTQAEIEDKVFNVITEYFDEMIALERLRGNWTISISNNWHKVAYTPSLKDRLINTYKAAGWSNAYFDSYNTFKLAK